MNRVSDITKLPCHLKFGTITIHFQLCKQNSDTILVCRYRGKKTPDAILAEICWWSRCVFEAQEDEQETSQIGDEPMSVDIMYASDESCFDDSEDDGTAYGYQQPKPPQQQSQQPSQMQGRGRGHARKLELLPQLVQGRGRGRGRGQTL